MYDLNQFTMLDIIQLGIFVIDKNYRVVFWNTCLENWSGINKNTIENKNLCDFYPHINDPRYKSRLDLLFKNGTPIIFSSYLHKHLFPMARKNGEQMIQHTTVTSVPSGVDEAFLAVITIEDVTELTGRVEELNKTKTEIESINKKLERYTYSIGHDLKEPIRSIRMFSQIISEQCCFINGKKKHDYFERIVTASDKISHMIDDLLILSRVGKHDIAFQQTSVEKIIKEVEFCLAAKIKQTGAVITYTHLPEIQCQPLWLSMVFQNLLSNSIKYADKDTIRIDIGYEELTDFHEFSVTDNGRGIKKEQWNGVFELFKKAHHDKTIEGSGAGLAIVASIIEEHKGTIRIDWSEVGVGTTVKFTIAKNPV